MAHSAKYFFFLFSMEKASVMIYSLDLCWPYTHTHKHFPSFRSGSEGLGKGLGLVVALSFRSFKKDPKNEV